MKRTLAAICVMTLTAIGGWAVAAEPLAHVPAVPGLTGVGEPLILVVADVTASTSAAARRDALNERFGAIEGFSTDATDAYDVRGALVQTSPEAVSVTCPATAGPFTARLRAARVQLECAPGFRRVLVGEPVDLRFVARDEFASYPFPSACGSPTTPPCQQERYRELFGSDLMTPRGKTFVATAFRTREGAEAFIAFARAVGVHDLVAVHVLKLGGGDVGLGQEPHPDGSGPLLGPLSDQERYQR